MKMIKAATEEQEKYAEHVATHLREHMLPMFFSHQYQRELVNMDILELTNLRTYSMKEVMELTCAIHTLSIVLERMYRGEDTTHLRTIFKRNQQMLHGLQVNFPFDYVDFILVNDTTLDCSIELSSYVM
ncbi:hypothetical protein N781_02650 [Pontibacillus halophilus JSM 076056 = DSM 19796]|uniref:Uncharacterized protein n=1 Tax=Pontibacillus halophilus JSM 076056 = DSM 19796 TaxID=1385510 RepID=A0A0A5I8B1_9BACI|nr:DUF5365 family protein [Pontibacillus halophilus]KGX92062.1 hypothetical protein N781_02650 [Pontibacillus halophilus JSM 076056 = DSM 19796]